MRSNFLYLLPILLVLGTNILPTEAKYLKLNDTIANVDCPVNGSVYCDFTDAKYWMPAEAPVNGDDLHIQANVRMELRSNLDLASLVINRTMFTLSNTVIKVSANIVVKASDPILTDGAFNVTNGYIQVQTGTYTFGGTLMFDELYIENMQLDYNTEAIGNSLTTTELQMYNGSSLNCRTLMTQILAAEKLICKTVILWAEAQGRHGAFFQENSVITTLLITAPINYVSIAQGTTLMLGAMFFTGPDAALEQLSISGQLISTNPLIFNYVSEISLFGGSMTAPYVSFDAANIYATQSTIVGDVTFFSACNFYPTLDVHIYGNVNTDINQPVFITLVIYPGSKAGAIDYGKVIVHGQLLQTDIVLGYQMYEFIFPAPQPFPFITYETSNTTNIKVESQPGTFFDITPTQMSFRWEFINGLPINCTNNNTPVQTPVSTPTTKDTPQAMTPAHATPSDPFTTLNIVLMAACAALVIAVIALGVMLAKKKSTYQPIQ